MSDYKRNSARLLVALTIIAILAAACAPALTTARPDAGTQDGAAVPATATVVRAMTSEPATIDPQGAPSSGLSLVLPYLFDTLVVRSVDNRLLPGIAESWTVADDGTEITMRLVPDVTFHDGTLLDAEAVRQTFERFKNVGVRSPIYAGVNEIEAIEVVDELTVRFSFAEPTANFWSTISMPYAGIISPSSMRAVDDGQAENLVGSGPFTLASWERGRSMTMASNPDYNWGPAVVENQSAPYIDEMVFQVIPDASTQLAALETGEVDVIFINQPSHRDALAGNPDVELHDTVLNSLIYLGFNCAVAPFDDVLVRQALSHAVNKSAIVSLALGGLGKEAFAPLPPTLLGFDESLQSSELAYDPERSRSLLQEAGFVPTPDGGWERNGEPLQGRLLTSTRAPNDLIAALLQNQLGEIGFPVEIQQLDSKAVMEATSRGDFDLLLWRYDWNDPDALNIFLGTDRIGSTNRVAYSNPEVDDLLELGAHELDDARRVETYVEAQQLILADAPWQPLYNPIDVIAIRKRVQGAVPGYMGRLLVNDAQVATE